jgi:Ca2+-binding RTX toxin-like protein
MGGDDFIAADGGPVFIGQYTLTTATTLLLGGDGNDTIWGDTEHISNTAPGYYQPAIIRGGAGNDELYNGLEVSAGSGSDYVYGGNIDSTIKGGAGDDEIEATYGDHVVFGGVGQDLVWTEALHGGTNTVDLGDGNDIGAVFSYDPQFAHRFDGGDGVDRFLFEDDNLSFTTRVVIDLQDPSDGAIGHIGTVEISNFECLTLLLAVEHDDIIRLDDFDDYVDASDGDDLVVGRGGADYLDGSYGEDTILGGQGNDVVIAGPSPGNVHEKVRGGAGDDVVYGNFSAADYAGEALLYGGAGRDVFSFLPSGTVTPDRVKDFDPVDDYVSVYMGRYYFVEPTSHEFDQLVPIDLADTDSELRFTYRDRVDDFNVHTIEVVYDREDGTLTVHDIESPGADEILVCTFAGAPALHIEHFLTMPEFYGPDSVGAEYYGGDAATGDALALARSLWSAGATAHGLFVDGAR